jgi:hypothetical protein
MGTQTATRISWQLAHETLTRLARQRASTDAEEGRWLLAALRNAAHVHMGFGSFNEYVERYFGYRPRSTQDKLRVAEALENLPAFDRALSSGDLNWCAVRELTRVATRETEQGWLEFARGKTTRQLERVLAGKRPGDTPNSPSDPSLRRHVLRFEVTPETFALFQDALNELRRRAGASLDDDSALLEMARHILGGPRDEGRSSYQIALALCPDCNIAQQQSAGGLVPIDTDVARMARCDAQHLALRPANDCTPHDGAASNAHVGAGHSRTHQSIPPAVRRAVIARDQRRCQVPGCTNATWLDVHHLRLRSDGGRNSADNLVYICSAHHRAAHRGTLLLERLPDGSLRARHADGSDYGAAVNPHSLDLRTKVFSALRNMGFREAEARAAIELVRCTRSVSFAELLREALGRLHRAQR